MDWLLRYVPPWRPLCVQHSADHSTVQCTVTTFWISDFLANVAWALKCWDSQDTSNGRLYGFGSIHENLWHRVAIVMRNIEETDDLCPERGYLYLAT